MISTYGTRGITSPGNKPGSRLASVSWTDNTGNFLLCGGSGITKGFLVRYDDLWRFTPPVSVSVPDPTPGDTTIVIPDSTVLLQNLIKVSPNPIKNILS